MNKISTKILFYALLTSSITYPSFAGADNPKQLVSTHEGKHGACVKFEAENYDAELNTKILHKDDGKVVEIHGKGAWISFKKVEFPRTAAALKFRIASEDPNPELEVRLDSPTGALIGTVNAYTGAWKGFEEKTISIIHIEGIHDLVIVGKGGWSRLNWIEFSTL